jgi:predicted N-acetyltransferase YhbS
MSLDLTECRIREPAGSSQVDLYRLLGKVFPPDRELFEWLIASGRPLYTWTSYTLYRGEEIVGNVSLMPLRIWLDGQPIEVVGVASVFTRPQYQHQGVARHLLKHCLTLIDQQRLPAVLFTGCPEVYSGVGFVRIGQEYWECRLSNWPAHEQDFQSAWLDPPTPEDWEAIAWLYDECPAGDGKLVRDREYWLLYQTLFRLNPHVRLVACGECRRWLGYARCEEESGRLLVSEFCCPEDREEIAESLMEAIAEKATLQGRTLLLLALAPGHFLYRFLRSRGVELVVEGPTAGREVFMVRPAAGQPLGRLGQLQWSLADKF